MIKFSKGTAGYLLVGFEYKRVEDLAILVGDGEDAGLPRLNFMGDFIGVLRLGVFAGDDPNLIGDPGGSEAVSSATSIGLSMSGTPLLVSTATGGTGLTTAAGGFRLGGMDLLAFVEGPGWGAKNV